MRKRVGREGKRVARKLKRWQRYFSKGVVQSQIGAQFGHEITYSIRKARVQLIPKTPFTSLNYRVGFYRKYIDIYLNLLEGDL